MKPFDSSLVNCNLASRNRRTTWLPLWGSWLPRKGQTERAEWFHFECYVLLSYCGTLSVSLFGCQLSQRESQGRCRACPPNYNLTFIQKRMKPGVTLRFILLTFICLSPVPRGSGRSRGFRSGWRLPGFGEKSGWTPGNSRCASLRFSLWHGTCSSTSCRRR